MSYHLNALASLIAQKEGKYSLSELGQDSYGLICKATAYSASNSLLTNVRRTLPAVIIANAILWASALFAVRQFEGHLNQLTVFSIAALWLVSNGILYSLLTTIRGQSKCIT